VVSLGNPLPEPSDRVPQGVLNSPRRLCFDTTLSPWNAALSAMQQVPVYDWPQSLVTCARRPPARPIGALANCLRSR